MDRLLLAGDQQKCLNHLHQRLRISTIRQHGYSCVEVNLGPGFVPSFGECPGIQVKRLACVSSQGFELPQTEQSRRFLGIALHYLSKGFEGIFFFTTE